MRFPTLIAACLLMSAQLAPAQDARNQSLAAETAAGVILLPTSVPGSVAYPHCDTCETRQYTIDTNTELFIGDAPVSLNLLRAEIAARPKALAMVSISADGRRIRTIYIAPSRPGE